MSSPARTTVPGMRDEMLYQAEQAVVIRGFCTRFVDLDAAHLFLEHILNSRAFNNLYPQVAEEGVLVSGARGVTGGAWWWGGQAEIRIPIWMATDFGVIHELSHICEPWVDQEIQHHDEWRRCELALVRRFMGNEASKCLRHAMLAYGLGV